MKKTVVSLFLIAALVPGIASAQDVLQAPLGSQEFLDFQTGSGVGAVWGGVQVGPYGGQLTSAPGQPQVTLYCVDFAHYAGDQTANVTNIGGSAPAMQNTRAGLSGESNSAAQVRYQKAAFLASLFDSYASAATQAAAAGLAGFGSAFSKQAAYSGIHAAIWTVMGMGAPAGWTFPSQFYGSATSATINSVAAPWIAWANYMSAPTRSYGGLDFSQWSVLTDVNAVGQLPLYDGTQQEYLVRTIVTETATGLLAVAGLALFGLVGWRRREAPGLVMG